MPVDPCALLGPSREAAMDRAVVEGLAVLARGRSVVIHTALGPSTDLGPALAGEGRHAIGRGLGRILRRLVAGAGLSRAVVAGGDTSSHALRELELLALSLRRPISASPGSPLCLGASDTPEFDGVEIAFKGGQIGDDTYFSRIRDGRI